MRTASNFDDNWIGEPNSGCWLWDKCIVPQGYGHITIKGRGYYAHRASYEKYVGPIPTGMSVLHKCDVPSCVNPAHLFLGTHADNMRDKTAKSRQSRGEAHKLAKLSEEKVSEIRASNLSRQQLAAKYGVREQTIIQVLNRITWKHVA
jgi:DNA-binding XRE family transcriptional regulator